MQKLGDYYNYDFLELLNDSLEHLKAFFYWHIKLVLQYIYYSTYHSRNSFRNKFWILILICKNDVNLVAIITNYIFFFFYTKSLITYWLQTSLLAIIFANMNFCSFWLNPVPGCYFVMYKETKPLIQAKLLRYIRF